MFLCVRPMLGTLQCQLLPWPKSAEDHQCHAISHVVLVQFGTDFDSCMPFHFSEHALY